MTLFIVLAIVLTLTAIALVAMPLLRTAGRQSWPAATLSAVVIGMAAYFTYDRVSDYPWPRGGSPAADAGIEEFERRTGTTPGNAAAWIELGQEHQRQGRHTEARDAFRQAMALDSSASDELRMAYAESAILADPSALAADAGQIVEEMLQRHPDDPRVLWFGGMVAASRGEPDTAKTRWRQLLELSPPPEVRSVLEKQIAALDSPAGVTTIGSAMPPIKVHVAVTPELSATLERLDEQAALFLIARLPDVPGPPLAVLRRPVDTLPLDVLISEEDVLTPEKLSETISKLQLTARISRTGRTEAAAGDWYGEEVWRPGSDQAVTLIIDRVIE